MSLVCSLRLYTGWFYSISFRKIVVWSILLFSMLLIHDWFSRGSMTLSYRVIRLLGRFSISMAGLNIFLAHDYDSGTIKIDNRKRCSHKLRQ